MSDRPTPEQVLGDGWTTEQAADGLPSIRAKTGSEQIAALNDAGYVIVHPADVVDSEYTDIPYERSVESWSAGWDACRAVVFGGGS